MRACHFEMIRGTLLKNMDFNNGFAVWRVQEPWQPITKKVSISLFSNNRRIFRII